MLCGRLSSNEAVDGSDLIETRLPARAVAALLAAGARPSFARPAGSSDEDEDDDGDTDDDDDKAADGCSNAMRVRCPRGDSTKTTATRVHANVRPTAAT